MPIRGMAPPADARVPVMVDPCRSGCCPLSLAFEAFRWNLRPLGNCVPALTFQRIWRSDRRHPLRPQADFPPVGRVAGKGGSTAVRELTVYGDAGSMDQAAAHGPELALRCKMRQPRER